MKVILLRDVARLGRKSDIKEVPDGHALNFLIPRKLAMVATKENVERVQTEAGKVATAKESALQAFRSALQKHAEVVIKHTAEANEQGSLFKGINAENVATILNAEGFSLTKHHIDLAAPIKTVGVHTIPLTYGTEKGTVQLEVVKK